ncbi:MAG: hypothetical protein R2882_04785 [Gemmatimonadales bacterium]
MLLFGLAPNATHGQQQTPAAWQRNDRIVVWSPHFDRPTRPYRNLDCPKQPLRLYGFEGDSLRDGEGALLVRVLRYSTVEPMQETPEPGVRVWLQARFDDGGPAPLPAVLPWAQVTKAGGTVVLRGPPGVYQLSIGAIGFPLDTGVVRIRPHRSDSLRAFIHQAPIC